MRVFLPLLFYARHKLLHGYLSTCKNHSSTMDEREKCFNERLFAWHARYSRCWVMITIYTLITTWTKRMWCPIRYLSWQARCLGCCSAATITTAAYRKYQVPLVERLSGNASEIKAGSMTAHVNGETMFCIAHRLLRELRQQRTTSSFWHFALVLLQNPEMLIDLKTQRSTFNIRIRNYRTV